MKGDAEAFAEVYRIFINTIYFNVNCSLNDKSETEDAVQQVVLSLHKGLPKLKSPYAFHSYLYRITINVCNKYNKKEARQHYGNLDEAEDDLLDDSTNTPSEEFELKERDKLVRLFISKLPEKQRYTLVLYYYYDMPYKNIAEVMKTSVTVVGSNINRAKKNMKQMLEEYENKKAGTEEGEETFQGSSLDSVFAAGVVVAVDSSLDPSAAQILWQKIVDHAPELLLSATAAKIKITALTALAAGVAAATIVIGAGVMMVQYAYESQPPSTVSTTHQTYFIPEFVSINYESADPAYPETYNPIRAEIELSDGTPLEWRIVDSDDNLIVSGTGWVIGSSYFEDLTSGTYRAEWTIENDDGDRGIARRQFTIHEETIL